MIKNRPGNGLLYGLPSILIGVTLTLIVTNLLLGAWTFSYVLWVVVGKTAPLWVNILCGLIGGEVTVPLAVIFYLLSLVGIHGPLFAI